MPDQLRTRYLSSKKETFGSMPFVNEGYCIGHVRLGREFSELGWQDTAMRSPQQRHALY